MEVGGGPKRWALPVEIVEEGQEVEGQFAPAFLLTEGQDVGVHDGRGVVESGTAHHGSAHVPAAQVLMSPPLLLRRRVGWGGGGGCRLTSRHDKPAEAGSDRG